MHGQSDTRARATLHTGTSSAADCESEQPLRAIAPDSLARIGRECAPGEPPAQERSRVEPSSTLTPRSRKRLLMGVGVVLALAVAAALWLHFAGSAPPLVPLADRQDMPLVSVMVPGVRPVSTRITVTGTIEARHDLPIGDAGQAGRIDKVYVQVGDHVSQGQVLAQLDASVLAPQVTELIASLTQARAQAKLALTEYRRALSIGPQSGLSLQNIEQLQATSAMDAANVKMVAAQLAQKRADLALTRVVAPVSGIVLTRAAEVGQIASPGGPALFTLEAAGKVELVGEVVEQDMASLRVGQRASVRLIGYRRPFPGRIWLLGATIDPQNRLGEVRIALAPNPALRPGAFAHATIMVDRAEHPVVPQTAVLTHASGSYVFVVDRRGVAVRRPVQIGGVTSSGVVIAKGLTGSERVVTLAGGFLQSGEKVRVAPTGSARS